jgi:hypothetical protein
MNDTTTKGNTMDTTTVTRFTRGSVALGKYLGVISAEVALISALSKVTDATARAEMTKALADISALVDGLRAEYRAQSFTR